MYIEQYIKEVIKEQKNQDARRAITEILVHNNYDVYNNLDENLKLKVKSALRKAIIYGSIGTSLIGGYGMSGGDITTLREPVAYALSSFSNASDDEIIKQSVEVLTTGEYSMNKSLPENIKKQLAIIMSNRDPLKDGKFIVVDDKNRLLFLFTPEGKKEFTSAVITGRDLDENKSSHTNFTNWLRETGNFAKYKEAMGTKNKEIKNRLFNAYLSYVRETGQKITPTGLYTLTKIAEVGEVPEGGSEPYTQDPIAYGKVGKISISPGFDSPITSGSNIAIHGTGIKGRKKALKKAGKYLKRRGTKAKPKTIASMLNKVHSYGCINLLDRNLKKLISLVDTETTLYVMKDTGDGVVHFGSQLTENGFAILDSIVKRTDGLLTWAYTTFRSIVGAEPPLQVNKEKFTLK